MSEKQKLIKSSFRFSLSNIILRFSQAIQGLIIANILGPSLYGLKNAMLLIQDYGNYSHLGLQNTFSKERQKLEYEDIKKRDYITNITFSFFCLVSIIFFILSLGFYFLFDFSQTIKLSVLIIGLLVPVSLFLGFFSIMLQARHNFKEISKINLMQAIIVSFFVIILVYFLGIIGYFLGALIGSLIILFLRWKTINYKPKLIFDFQVIFKLLKKGIYLFLFTLTYLVFFTIDRVFILYGFGNFELGLYAIGLFFAQLMYFFITTLIIPLVPKIYQNLKNKELLRKLILLPMNLTYKGIFYIIFMIIFLLPLIMFILPQYSNGIEYVSILIFSIVFYPALIVNYFIGKNKEKFLLKQTILFLLIAFILNLLIILFNLPAIYIAFATMITFFFYGTTLNLIGFKELLGSYKKSIKEIFDYLWPLVYSLIGYGLLWILAHFWLYFIMNYYIVKVIQAVLFTIWYLPILWKIEKEHKILKIIWKGIKNKFSKQDLEKIE
jgi:O-antigen/teichoic acid export membrane protein